MMLQDRFYSIAARLGWVVSTQVAVMLEFLESRSDEEQEAFLAFLAEKVDFEEGGIDDDL